MAENKKKWHLTLNGEPARCEAEKKACPRSSSPHFDTRSEATAYFESSMSGNLLATISRKFPGLKKLARVGATASVALASVVGVSSIASAAEPQQAGWLDSVDSVSQQLEEFSKDAPGMIDKGADRVNDWLSKESVKDSSLNQKVTKTVDKAPGLGTFRNFLESLTGNYNSTTATVADDGSIVWQGKSLTPTTEEVQEAKATLENLEVINGNSGEGYDRGGMFGSASTSTRATIEQRDLVNGEFNSNGRAISGTLRDPYTGESIDFQNSDRPYDLEHIVALKEVYRSENPSHPLTQSQRESIANDPNNLLLVSSSENRSKGDKDAKDYLPSYTPSQCRFAISTIQVKSDYNLTVDPGEYKALSQVLDNRCQ